MNTTASNFLFFASSLPRAVRHTARTLLRFIKIRMQFLGRARKYEGRLLVAIQKAAIDELTEIAIPVDQEDKDISAVLYPISEILQNGTFRHVKVFYLQELDENGMPWKPTASVIAVDWSGLPAQDRLGIFAEFPWGVDISPITYHKRPQEFIGNISRKLFRAVYCHC